MRRALSVALLFLVIVCGLPASAQILFDNGPPDFSNGFEMGLRVLADDFTLNVPSTPKSIRFWSIESTQSSYNGSISWWIYSDSFGGAIPGSPIPGYAGSSQATRTYLGQGSNSISPNEFLYEFDLGPLPALAPGTYWLVLHNGPLTQNQFTGFAWALTAPNATPVSQQSTVVNGGFGTNISGWFTNGKQLAFQILMDPPVSVSRRKLNFGAFSNGQLITSGQSVQVTVPAGTGWTATSNTNFIILAPPAGTGPKGLTIGIDSTQVPTTPGTFTGTITILSLTTGSPTTTIAVTLNVFDSANAGPPFGNFETPGSHGFVITGAIPVTGWALDSIEVTKVDVWREAIQGEVASPNGLIYIGDAVLVAGARPDVEAAYPSLPFNNRAGWGYQMLTNFLPQGNGTFTLHAIAHDKAGNSIDLGTKTITVDNAYAAKPFGTIDTPTQGGTISGTDSVNFGWALTPQTAMIPMDGSTITVVIDGVPVGHPTYNQFRSDIANLFPGYANSNAAVGFFHINTTALANGIHTISWNAYDNLGRGEGLGSRYFNVQNTGGVIAAPEDAIDESVAREGVRVRHGLNASRLPEPVAPDADGGYSVTMEEVSRIELYLGAVGGNMLAQGEVRPLPIGSTLKGGVFYWQPGPGFLGEYAMQFGRADGTRIALRVTIVPKRDLEMR